MNFDESALVAEVALHKPFTGELLCARGGYSRLKNKIGQRVLQLEQTCPHMQINQYCKLIALVRFWLIRPALINLYCERAFTVDIYEST